jgi:hypothetical protein
MPSKATTPTFKLFARESDGGCHIEYLHCPPAEVVARARALLDTTHAAEIEVRMGEQYMFTIDRSMLLQFN